MRDHYNRLASYNISQSEEQVNSQKP